MTNIVYPIGGDLDYLAGLFDGDGCASITCEKVKNNLFCDCHYRAIMSIKMTDSEPVELFARQFKGKLNQTIPKNEKHQKYFSVYYYNNRAALIAKKIVPLMKIRRKRLSVFCIIDFAKTVLPQGGTRSLPILSIVERSRLYNYCRTLNQQGSNNLFVSKTGKLMEGENITLNYLAGLFDAEGMATIIKTKDSRYNCGGKYYALLNISMADLEPIKAFATVFGGRIVTNRLRNALHSRIHVIHFTVEKTKSIIQQLQPYLRIERKKMVFAYISDFLSTFEGKYRYIPFEILSQREDLRLKCKKLNKKGR